MDSKITRDSISINLDNLELEDIEVFLQEGSRGIGEFAASCSTICCWYCCAASCNACGVTQSADAPVLDMQPGVRPVCAVPTIPTALDK